MSNGIIKTHYDVSIGNRVAYAKFSLIHKLSHDDNLEIILNAIKDIQNNPMSCGQETIGHKIASNLHVLWRENFYFLYRWHKPTVGPYSKCEWLVHILDMGIYRTDEDGNKILDIYEDPNAIQTLSERDGELIVPERMPDT